MLSVIPEVAERLIIALILTNIMVGKGIKEYFNLPEEYFSHRGPTVDLIEELEEKWFLNNIKINRQDVVLDFACGLGRWTKKLSPRVRKVYSIDISPKPLSSLKKQKLENIKIIIGSDEKLIHFKEYFDKIIFAQGLEFYSSPITLLKKLRYSLKQGGELFISTWTPVLIKDIRGLKLEKDYVIVPRLIDNKKIEVFCKLRTKNEVKNLLQKTGYKKVQVEFLSIDAKSLPMKVKKLFTKKPSGRLNVLVIAKAIK